METQPLHALGLSAGLINHLATENRNDPFWYRCQPAHYWRSSPIAKRGIIAIWECGTTIHYFSPQTKRFEICSLEDIDNVWASYATSQALLAHLFLDCYEDELSDENLRGRAVDFGFQHIERMLSEAQAQMGKSTYGDWRISFPATCA